MKDRFKEPIKYIVVFLLSQINFLLLPIYTRNLSASEFGLLELSFATINSLAIVFSFGLHQYIGIKYFKVKNKKSLIITFTFYYVLLSIPLIILSIVLGFFYGKNLGFSFLIILIIVFSAFIINFKHLLLSIFNMSYKTNKYLKYVLLNMILIVGLTLLILHYSFSVEIILVVFFLSNLIFLIFPYQRRNEIKKYITIDLFNKKEVIQILKVSIPLILIGFLHNGLNIQDRFFISALLDNEQVGIYSLAYKMSNALFVFLSFMIANLYMRVIYKNLGKDNSLIYQTYINNIKIVIILIFILVLIFSLYYLLLEELSEYFIFVYDNKYYTLSKYLLISFYLQTLFSFFSFVILFLEKVLVQAGIYAIALIINAIGNYILIPYYDIYGAVYATIFTNIFLLLMFIFVSYNIVKRYKVKNWKKIN